MNKPVGPLHVAYEDRAGPARFSTVEFLRMAEVGAFDDMKVELIDGELARMTPPMNDHGARQATLMIHLGALVPAHLLRGEVGIQLGEDTILACDVALLRDGVEGRRLLRSEDLALVVEIAETTAARDMGLKRLKYAQAGIPLYWVVDGARSVVHVYAEPLEGDYAQVSTVRFGQPLALPGSVGTITLG